MHQQAVARAETIKFIPTCVEACLISLGLPACHVKILQALHLQFDTSVTFMCY